MPKNKKPVEGFPSPKILQMHSDLAFYFLAQALVELAGPVGSRNTDFVMMILLHSRQLAIIEKLEAASQEPTIPCPHCDSTSNYTEYICYWCRGSGQLTEADYARWQADQSRKLAAVGGWK